jgi:hypothetical protein
LQLIPQLVPSHVAMPFVGAVQALHDDAPHELIEELLTQAAVQTCCMEGHWQALETQPAPVGHAIAQELQWLESFVKFTHAVGFASLGHPFGNETLVQEATQFAPRHAVPPLGGAAGHAAHVPMQFNVFGGQALHMPLLQPFGHFVPQMPQLFGSVCALTQTPLHNVIPVGHTHAPILQIVPPAHALPHVPQLLVVVKSTQVVPHTPNPVGHTQFPELQVAPVAHFVPQTLQLFGSVCVLTQTPLQLVCPDGQTHIPETQLVPPVHFVPQALQLFESVCRLTQALPHTPNPVGHAQTPELQVPPEGQTVPHAPQLFASPEKFTHVFVLAQRFGNDPPHATQVAPLQVGLPFVAGGVGHATQAVGVQAFVFGGHGTQALLRQPPGHTLPHVPQLLLSAVGSTHELLHMMSPVEHTQFPLVHVELSGQLFPHAPQLVLSVDSLTHTPLHAVSPVVQTHALTWQVEFA